MTNQEIESNPHIIIRKYPVVNPVHMHIPDWMVDFQSRVAEVNQGNTILSNYLIHNTPCTIDMISVSRALSAYFSINLTLETPELLLEMGAIDTDGTAKLHNYLNRHINYQERQRTGYHNVSGHFAESSWGNIALLDQLSDGKIITLTQAILVSSLVGNNILPVGGDGIPVFTEAASVFTSQVYL
jgi:hypothetical protein